MVVIIDFANVQLLAVDTIASVRKSGFTRSIAATALFSRWSEIPAAIASSAKAQPQYRRTKWAKAIATVIANFLCTAIAPSKNDTPLLVDPNAVEALERSRQLLKPVTRGTSQVFNS